MSYLNQDFRPDPSSWRALFFNDDNDESSYSVEPVVGWLIQAASDGFRRIVAAVEPEGIVEDVFAADLEYFWKLLPPGAALPDDSKGHEVWALRARARELRFTKASN